MDKLKAMQTFVQIADHGSLTAAASAMDASLPAVVRSLAAFEAELGVRLFNRTTRRISLTDEGRRHLDSCRQLLNNLQEAEAALTADSAEPVGHLNITAPVQFGQMHVAPAITRFVQRYPQMRCSVLLYDRVVNLLEEGIDLGIRIGPLEDSSLVAQTIGHIRRVVVASPGYLQQIGLPAHPKDLLRANCVRRTGNNPSWGPFIDKGRPFSINVSGNLDFNQIAPAVEACAAGLGFGMFLSYQVAPYLATQQLQIVLEAFESPPRPLSVVYPHARLLPTRTRVLVNWMREELKGFGS
ncbi:DNA-binding transcriptional LysR family regulator [Rhodoferax ferrireducens]|uniref:DNA-binding transcriptional LysR family regulator n=1 Tax=Rhodoferax ferrireducens TaxID=192843 RepID=A0ABU2C8U9_9BURK|nr:LysR family transcriptional regulator [Rhodoferax ferrireducens]MDR7377748.1 DNA-binding transcriptional LysR family regulator [Rhodoferax ferrireducens]